MLGLIASLIGLIPGLSNLAASWHASALEAKVKMFMAETGANRDTAVELIRANAQVQTKWWFVAVIPPLFAIPFVIYTWKVVVWDNVLGAITHGNTDVIGGTVGWVYISVVSFYFLHGIQQSTGRSS